MKELEQAKAKFDELEEKKCELFNRIRGNYAYDDIDGLDDEAVDERINNDELILVRKDSRDYYYLERVYNFQSMLIYALERYGSDDAEVSADARECLEDVECYTRRFKKDLLEDIQKAQETIEILEEMRKLCGKFVELR